MAFTEYFITGYCFMAFGNRKIRKLGINKPHYPTYFLILDYPMSRMTHP